MCGHLSIFIHINVIKYDIALEWTNEKREKKTREEKIKKYLGPKDSNLHSYFNWNV